MEHSKEEVLLLVSHRVNLNPIGLLRVYTFISSDPPQLWC